MSIIKLDRSIIPACDVSSLEKLEEIVNETSHVKGVGGYKIGFSLVVPFGMRKVIETIRKHTEKPIIYDHQKAGTDIPALGVEFMRACKGADAVIIFPQAGPVTEKKWIEAAKRLKMNIIVGGEMTNPGYMEREGGFIKEGSPERMYETAASMGVRDFVVPGNKPENIKKYRELLESKGISPVFYSPGLLTQGGDLTESGKAAGKRWHAIVGRTIYRSENPGKTTEKLVRNIV